MTQPELKPESYSKSLFKKWLFVPNFSGNITVTDLLNGQHRERNLRPSDFQYEENAVPNYGMLTYVGISEISKEIEKLKAEKEAYREVATQLANRNLIGMRAVQDKPNEDYEVEAEKIVMAEAAKLLANKGTL